MIATVIAGSVLLLAQPLAADPSPVPTLSRSQKKALDGALDGMLAEKTTKLKLNETCGFELSLSANPKRHDRGVRITVQAVDPDAAEMPVTGRFALVRILDPLEARAGKKGRDDLRDFAPLTGDELGEEAEVLVPYDRFLEFARPVKSNVYFMGIDGLRGSPCLLDATATKALHGFRSELD